MAERGTAISALLDKIQTLIFLWFSIFESCWMRKQYMNYYKRKSKLFCLYSKKSLKRLLSELLKQFKKRCLCTNWITVGQRSKTKPMAHLFHFDSLASFYYLYTLLRTVDIEAPNVCSLDPLENVNSRYIITSLVDQPKRRGEKKGKGL